MIKRFFLLVLFMLPAPVWAQSQCYSEDEMRAEQLLRLHSELMVITVMCHQSSKGINLIPYYTGFTKRYIQPLHDAEEVMQHHYSATYGGNGVDQLDRLRTRLANEISQQIADSSAPEFCAERRDKVLVMYRASAHDVNNEVGRLVDDAQPYESLCDE